MSTDTFVSTTGSTDRYVWPHGSTVDCPALPAAGAPSETDRAHDLLAALEGLSTGWAHPGSPERWAAAYDREIEVYTNYLWWPDVDWSAIGDPVLHIWDENEEALHDVHVIQAQGTWTVAVRRTVPGDDGQPHQVYDRVYVPGRSVAYRLAHQIAHDLAAGHPEDLVHLRPLPPYVEAQA